MRKEVWPLLFIVTVLSSGCQQESALTHRVYFEDDIKIQYKSSADSCSYVRSADTYVIQDAMIEDGIIYVSNFKIICPTVDTSKIGVQELVYKIDDEEYIASAEVVDMTVPQIEAEDTIKLVAGSISEDLSDYFSVSDEIDDEKDITVEIDTNVKDEAGEYYLNITATDKSGNSSSKKITIIIEEPPKPEPPAQTRPNQSSGSESSGGNNSSPSSGGNSSGSSSSGNTSNPVVKDFLFSEGYDMSTAVSACNYELLSSGRSGNCTPIVGDDGIYLGMRLTLK